MSSEVIAAIFGALAAGLFQTILSEADRRRRKRATLVAIASEVAAICRLVRFRKYVDGIDHIISEIKKSKQAITVRIDIRENYFSVFESLSSNLGELNAEQVAVIVDFYSLCRSVVDSLHVDGVAAQIVDPDEMLQHHAELKALVVQILRLGDEIVQLLALPDRQLLESDRT